MSALNAGENAPFSTRRRAPVSGPTARNRPRSFVTWLHSGVSAGWRRQDASDTAKPVRFANAFGRAATAPGRAALPIDCAARAVRYGHRTVSRLWRQSAGPAHAELLQIGRRRSTAIRDRAARTHAFEIVTSIRRSRAPFDPAELADGNVAEATRTSDVRGGAGTVGNIRRMTRIEPRARARPVFGLRVAATRRRDCRDFVRSAAARCHGSRLGARARARRASSRGPWTLRLGASRSSVAPRHAGANRGVRSAGLPEHRKPRLRRARRGHAKQPRALPVEVPSQKHSRGSSQRSVLQ